MAPRLRFDGYGGRFHLEAVVAKTSAGKKIVPVKAYTRKVDGHKQKVDQHRRSTPHTSTRKAKSK